MIHTLLFQNPVFEPGINITVRNGRKWQIIRVGETLHLTETGEIGPITTAFVAGVIPINWDLTEDRHILEAWCYLEHDPKCRTIMGLTDELTRIYGGDRGLEWGPDLTVIAFLTLPIK